MFYKIKKVSIINSSFEFNFQHINIWHILKIWLHLSFRNIYKIKLLKKFFFWNCLGTTKTKNQQNSWTPLFLYYQYIIFNIATKGHSHIINATRLFKREFINYIEEWWQLPNIDLELQNRFLVFLFSFFFLSF